MPSATTPPTLTVIRNDAGSGPGRIPDWAASAGVLVDLVHADEGARIPAGADGLDALVLLGGGFLPDADDRAPWLPAERSLVRDCLDRGVPMLGICLGAQLIAQAAGGRVEGDYGVPEKGVTVLTPHPEAAGDVLFSSLPARVVGIESHRDQITRLPEGAVLLMSSEHTRHQAFRLGEVAWATQWHPESSADRVDRWPEESLRELGLDPADVKRVAREHADDLETAWRAFFGRFVEVVRRSAARG